MNWQDAAPPGTRHHYRAVIGVRGHTATAYRKQCVKCLNIPTYPSYLKELISVYTPSRMLRSADKYQLKKPVMQLKTFGEKSFYHAAPEVKKMLRYNTEGLDT